MGDDTHAIDQYVTDMRIAQLSPITIRDRLAVLRRLRTFAGADLLALNDDELRAFQSTFAGLAPASVDIYSRHMRAFYAWAASRKLIEDDPSRALIIPRLTKGKPHPVSPDDLRVIMAATTGALRLAYVLAAFAGLRRAEICALQRSDIDLSPPPTALIHGKGRRERIVPLLDCVVRELANTSRRGYILRNRRDLPFSPSALSIESYNHLRALGFETTLHSMRHSFATQAAKMTRDPLFVRDLLGHSSVATTEIYMDTSLSDAHGRLAALDAQGDLMLSPRHRLRSVR